MKRYVALLRGINISGKNKIAMSELKEGFAELGLAGKIKRSVMQCAELVVKDGQRNYK